MSCFDVAGLGHNSTEMLHYFIEATKHAFWCRLKYAGDPEVSPPPLDMLLSPEYWQETAGQFKPDEAKPFEYPGIDETAQRHTTHFVVADSDGNIVSATQTLGGLFGSKIMVPGTGIWLNNSLSYCTFEPKGNPMDAHAGRRKLSGDCPTIIFKDGKPVIALGTPGGHTIGQTVPQMVMNLIDFKMDIQQALSQPKVAFIEPDTIYFEYGIDADIIEKLKGYGHTIETIRQGVSFSNAHGLTIEYDGNGKPVRFTGGSDINGSGLAKGY
jgi:gamma-glutamyltranspeptidase/glutathione hydrolase